MNSLFFNKYINLTLFVILGNLRQTSSAALPSRNLISLYNATDKITILTSHNFSSTVYHSNTAWLIEFYSSWCGHCQSYANTYREIAIDTWAWKTIVRIGAINCQAEDNHALCREHKVPGFPTLQLIPPDAIFDNKAKVITIPAADTNNVERELIKQLENINTRNKTWPRLIPVNRITLEELYARIPKTIKLLIIIVEKREDLTGRQIMLDFSEYRQQLAIFRTTTDGKFWRKFHINITDVPALFVILRNRNVERIPIKQNIDHRNLFNYAIRSYIHKTKSIDNFNDHDFEEIILRKNAIKNAEIKQKLIKNNNITDDIRDKNTIHQNVNMIDLELVLSYMFRQEIPQVKNIQGESYNALVQWLTILNKYFPGREPVMAYLKHLLLKINEQSNGLSGDKFLEIIDMKTSNAYLPNDHEQYQHCAGSEPKYRGYPCALWLLFHTLTVSQYKQDLYPIDVIEIPLAIKNYIKYFFGCRQCSENFMKETMDINQLNLTNKYEAIIYLWKIHNHVNKRLRNDITEDPKHPKVQFPSKYLCETCQLKNNNEYDVSKTIEFLLVYYSKENIDTSLLNKSHHNEDLLNQSKSVISKMVYSNELTEQFGYFKTILQRFSLYIFIGLIIIIILFRRRYCRTKIKRYTI